ncbi:maleylpyruvate isomerase family mycothiol-dependent enzyme [Pseudonocardia sp. TRM90224]|uniref:maleylpyruvate isomerase family mycothiol-dependent enzyme n=1 Tax=Pseudonocardia sp. TRM90224 TaxID=2812678 RepID=UPI001E557B34|nr:maleylpyruvate isomerase family mycothiol-dependent enzyme [Pseudonocardia sp. TRM90224]
MDADAVHEVVKTERTELADLLAGLSSAEWAAPTPCAGWTVRDLAAHLSAAPRAGLAAVVTGLVRARGDVQLMIGNEARSHAAAHTPDELVAELRAAAGSRKRAPGTSVVEPMLDVLVHGQDLAGALGRTREMPPGPATVAAQRAWSMGFPFGAQRRLRGLRLVATDVEWAVGAGVEVRGPVAALLLLATGRRLALPHLDGPGAAQLADRLPA